MSQFEFMTVAQSLILGLAVALLLSSSLVVFRHRDDASIAWIPLVWAACVFVSQIQFWWSLGFLLNSLDVMSGPAFSLSILQGVTLFLAGGLILPQDSEALGGDLQAYFLRDGRWGVAAYGLYWMTAFTANVVIHGVDPLIPLHATVVALVVLCFSTFRSSRWGGAVAILATVALLLNTLWPRPDVFG